MSEFPRCRHGVGDPNNLVECKDCLIENLQTRIAKLEEAADWDIINALEEADMAKRERDVVEERTTEFEAYNKLLLAAMAEIANTHDKDIIHIIARHALEVGK